MLSGTGNDRRITPVDRPGVNVDAHGMVKEGVAREEAYAKSLNRLALEARQLRVRSVGHGTGKDKHRPDATRPPPFGTRLLPRVLSPEGRRSQDTEDRNQPESNAAHSDP